MFGDWMINAKCQYVGDGLRVRRRRTPSPLTTYFSQLNVPQIFSSKMKC